MNSIQAAAFYTEVTIKAGGPGSGRHANESAHRELISKGFKHISTENVPGKSHEETKPGSGRYKSAKISTYKRGSATSAAKIYLGRETRLVHEDGSIHKNMGDLNKHLEDMADER